ncbi:DUF2490 domain-containing protein [Costertonia aggregata]|nr:DUF2490 domain-containing protein [Costertonia aggregata]
MGNIVLGQDNFTGFWESDIALNYTVFNNYSHNFKVSQRSYTYDEKLDVRIRQIDLVHFSNVKISGNQSIALGVQYRFRNTFEADRENELRFTQQYNITSRSRNIRFGHRVRSEQRINKSLTTHRFRYRFALDFPLQGEQLDVGEAYLVTSTESLLSVARANASEYDQRFTANIGWLLHENTKLQAGLEYRFEDYTHRTENILFVLTSLVFSL